MGKITKLRNHQEEPVIDDRLPTVVDDQEALRKIGKSGAVKYTDGTLTVEHPTWMNAIGTDYRALSEFVAEQMVILCAPSNKVSARELSFVSEAVMGMAPRDHVELMLTTQMAAVHLMTMKMATDARKADTVERLEAFAKMTNQLMRTFTSQTEALKKYRSNGTQTVKVKHVHVHEGGQAVVGNVVHGGGGK